MRLVVPDAYRDPRFFDNPLVTGNPRVCFYAGMPLRTSEGFVLGTLCAIDHVPRAMAVEKLAALELLAGQAARLLELRHAGHLLEQAHEEATASRRWFRVLLDQVPAMVGYWDPELRNVFANQAYSDWFGKPPEEIHGHHIRELLGEELYAANLPFLTRALHGERLEFPRTIETPSGLRHSAASYVPDQVGDTVRGIVVLVTDMTELQNTRAHERQLTEELERLVRTDVLTSLLNRRGGLELAEREGKRALRKNERLHVAMLDIDHFKHINDSHGHAVGDEVLRRVSQSLASAFRTVDICARWGGEEFLVVLCGTDAEGALLAVERARVRVAAIAELPCAVTVSVGLAEWDPAKKSIAEATAEADGRLYIAKASGRNCVVAAA